MKNKIYTFLVIASFIFFLILLMLIDDGFLGEITKETTSYFILIFCIIMFVFVVITQIWYKVKQKKGR